MQDRFVQRKKSILEKNDKSTIGSWDKRIVRLCKKINKFSNYYTTSSCSGRVALILDKENQREDLFVKVWHEKVLLKELMKELGNIDKDNIRFKQEPPILHIACKDVESAKRILEKARVVGFKRSGVISFSENKFIVELLSTEKIEFPIIKNGNILVDDEFLKIVLEKANRNLERGWGKIEELRERI